MQTTSGPIDPDAVALPDGFEPLPPEERPQDPHMDGTGLRFETMDHGGEYPDTMPQAIKLIDAEPQSSRPKLQAVSALLDL